MNSKTDWRSIGLKSGAALVLTAVFCVVAGIYGIIHDQISYTVSNEYFTKFKFIQFAIPAQFHNRIGVAMVGFLATWWMGLLIGFFLIPFGLIIPGWKNYFFGMLKTILVVTATALTVGLGALIYGAVTYSPDHLYFAIPDNIEQVRRYFLCGNMHNYSYLGGLLGIITGVLWISRERLRVKTKS